MYFLVYIVPQTGGTGFGVVFAILVALAMLIGAGQFAATWVLAPVATSMALLCDSRLWWIFPLAVILSLAINWVSAKIAEDSWFPLLSASICLILSFCFFIGLSVFCLVRGDSLPWYYIFVVCLGTIGFALVFYSTLNTFIAITSITTLSCGYKPCVGAFCSLLGMIGAAFCLQSIAEGIFTLFRASDILEQVCIHIEEDALTFMTFGLVSKESTPDIFRRMESTAEAIASIPTWLRFFLGLIAAIGCGIGEHACSNAKDLF